MNRRSAWALLLTVLLTAGCSRAAVAPAASPQPAPAPASRPTQPAAPPTAPSAAPVDAAPSGWHVTPENLAVVAEQHHPNEAGKVLILEYHHFGPREDRWTRNYDNFKNDLETLYKNGFRAVNLRDYLDGKMDLPAGTSPVIFTFDDSLKSQFRLEQRDGQLQVAPDTAVSILLDFARQHPDFGVAGTFYVNMPNPFPGDGTPAQRLQWLVDHGFEIGNHTWSHENLGEIPAQAVQSTLARQAAEVAKLVPGYEEISMALPFGVWPAEHKLAWQGESQGVRYSYRAVLLVGAEPAPSPYVKGFDPLALPRVQGTDTDNQMQMWLSNLKTTRYISDGDPEVIVVPRVAAANLKPEAVGQRRVLTY